MTISALEKETGISRSTIHFYVREGLLPRPQKTAASRALYSDDHVTLLLKIRDLKDSGLSLAETRSALGADLARAQENGVDLASQESERMRRAILRVATEEFTTKGYKGTHVATIVRSLGITSQVFYSHFPSKLQLFVESFQTFLRWNLAFVEPKVGESQDQGERILKRLQADYRANQFGSEVIAQISSDQSQSRLEKKRLADLAWEDVVNWVKKDFESVRPAGSPPPPISLELLVYSMLGAHHNASLVASWDERFTRADTLRLHLWLWLAAVAAMSGEVDIDSRIAPYEELIQELAVRRPETPPPLED